MTKKFHAGVYGVIVHDGKIILVHKARGPYTGKLDLPGGRPEMKETVEQTLIREVKEETGITVTKALLWYQHTHHVNYTENDVPIELAHTATVFKVKQYDLQSFNTDIHQEDVHGAEWYALNTVRPEQLSPLAIYALEKIWHNDKKNITFEHTEKP